MMHFSVLVIGPECANALQDVLTPYFEHDEFEPYIKFTREDKKAERKRLKRYWGKKLRENPHDVGIFNKYEETNMSDDDYFRRSIKHYDPANMNSNGEPVSTYNPNSKWADWEYEKTLLRKESQLFVTTVKKKDIDWNTMSRYNYQQAKINWYGLFSPGFPTPTTYEKAMNDYWDGETKEQYMERSHFFLTHAYILHGKWYERGKIGWWQHGEYMDRDKWLAQYEKMLTQVKPNTVLTTIECGM